ncbi:ABC transporter ATP-binding protein [Mycoplasmopsis synoviae]|uniref:ABC transporter ATP-binding protein n=1 Tax=Mycoplasmopsis synoviae TaxID=2109 RepID=UPI00296243A7|nr:ABC transporter ATP-binding protein [Mycoplasmopsis synoviae]UBX97871.1 ATP-binding cassette domain-containing protein [Mycoplasmopsis synoviae]UBX98759.1 ATP-binding cassette domain-containing protein [Mycoplasmopsis synoviae]UBX99491.1 ATP-binding cassette domain-containing protein [Mycoplasmopsis synoviae]UBX99833.1 ATP-binding cassette domain-containing protein [Mycoplasmopsis synoviae]
MEIKSNNTVIKPQGLPSHIEDLYQKLKVEFLNNRTNSPDLNVLVIDNIDKVYENGFQAVFETSLFLKKGEFLSLLGPSGCGKTTTLRAIAGLDTATSGQIYINGADVTYSEPIDRDITMVFQNYALFPHLSVRKNITFGLDANPSKIGKEAKYYKEEKFIKNKINNLKQIQNDIVNLLKIKQKNQALLEKIQKHQAIYDKLKNKQSKKALSLFFKINRWKSVYQINTKKISALESDKENAQGYGIEVESWKKKLEEVKLKKAQAAKEDNKKEIKEAKLKEVSEILGLDYYLDRKPAALSGGQRQRVALGRSIVSNPTLFLMDEPLSNLDAKLRASMRSEIRKIHERVNAATVYVTHDQIEAMTMSDKIAIMSDGFIQQIGSPDEVYKNPANLFVAQFIGNPTMNLFEGRFKDGHFVSNDWKVLIPNWKTKNIMPDVDIVFGIRPQDIYLTNDDYPNSDPTYFVEVVRSELLGNEIQYVGVIKELQKEIVFITDTYNKFKSGQVTKISIIPDRIHIFDKQTTISLTSEFNYETLSSLKNWVESEDKIKVRRDLLEFSKKQKLQIFSVIKLLKNLVKKVLKK